MSDKKEKRSAISNVDISIWAFRISPKARPIMEKKNEEI